jgi:hypothetical protein
MIQILTLCFLQLSPLLAQDGIEPKHSNRTIDMLAILELFTSIEGEEHVPKTFKEKVISLTKKQTWQAVSQNLNVVNVATNSYRVYSMNMADPNNSNNVEKMEHVKNLAIILPLSHGVEMVAGEVSMLIAANMGTSIGGIAALGVIGAIIKIPFFVDPLCILFITSYKYFPMFRNGITFFRSATVISFTYLTKWTGLRQFWETFFYHKSVIEQLQRLQVKGWILRPGPELIVERPGLSIHLDFKNDHYFVKQVIGNLENSQLIRDLPFNIRQAIKRVVMKGNHEFYVENKTDSSFTFKDHSLPWNTSISRKQLCHNLWNF